MKKLIFIFSGLSMFLLFSFSKKPYLSVNSHMKALTCAKPYNLTATKDNSEVVLSWTIDDVSDLISCSYGGYFNTPNGPVGFSGSTYVWPIRISCPPSATSVHYSVNAYFQRCGHLVSDPVFIYFP
jgi:hypothetical protein